MLHCAKLSVAGDWLKQSLRDSWGQSSGFSMLLPMGSAHGAPCSAGVYSHHGIWSNLVKLYFLQQNWPAWSSVEDDWLIAPQTLGMDQSQYTSYSGWPRLNYEVKLLSSPVTDRVLLREQGQTYWYPSSHPISNSVNLTGMGFMEYSTVLIYIGLSFALHGHPQCSLLHILLFQATFFFPFISKNLIKDKIFYPC